MRQIHPCAAAALLVALCLFALANKVDTYRGAYAAICINAKDEGPYLVEFVLYHRWLGFGKIYVMDYNSSQPAANLRRLLPFIRTGLVEYHYDADPRHHSQRPGGIFAEYSQGTAFQRCIDFSHRDHMWMAFIDTDEYLVLNTPPGVRPNITSFLQKYEKHAALAVNFRIFGSSGHIAKPTVGTLEAYTQCSPATAVQNKHVKTIARLSQTLAIGGNPHEFVYMNNGHAVNEKGQPVKGPTSEPVSWDGIALHHYVTRSLADFIEKIQRGPGGSQTKRNLDWFRQYDGNATETCLEGIELWRTCCSDEYERLRAREKSGRRRRRGSQAGGGLG
ncbi:hypothetical protein HYH03_017550 [Edaphochlamys debaryana]|uniref:Glycosyltransferase family 92 protein n=1 Tax=Edaphochlamys debaryana TaxID=47281 RepID=A0A835XIV6_9CHLO|nr:hypothetical protein HYH03_017550 [Edaphochlamys debaryana]|eukprot:KAG2483608.1 hypothetical protein HYH03_017550 [Edaphochlamys debaryana]